MTWACSFTAMRVSYTAAPVRRTNFATTGPRSTTPHRRVGCRRRKTLATSKSWRPRCTPTRSHENDSKRYALRSFHERPSDGQAGADVDGYPDAKVSRGVGNGAKVRRRVTGYRGARLLRRRRGDTYVRLQGRRRQLHRRGRR